jgi:hypothetical protein
MFYIVRREYLTRNAVSTCYSFATVAIAFWADSGYEIASSDSLASPPIASISLGAITMQIIELKVGDRIPSANDMAYSNYSQFCGRLHVRPAAYADWLRFERLGKITSTSQATGPGGLGSYAESRKRAAALALAEL